VIVRKDGDVLKRPILNTGQKLSLYPIEQCKKECTVIVIESGKTKECTVIVIESGKTK